MATPGRRTNAALAETLFQEAYRFEFFQAVRLLELIFRQRARSSGQGRRFPIGRDAPPEQEIVRFRAAASLDFSASAIVDLKDHPAPAGSGKTSPPPEMQVTFMGLTGPSGVLPRHYTELLIQRVRPSIKDYALRDFLDLFNHRAISLFYRAWEKYRFPIAWERAQLDPEITDPFTQCLRSLVGLGTAHLSGRLALRDEVPLYYAGHFAHRPRSAIALESLLGDYLQLPVQIDQFQGCWLYVSQEEQTRFPGPDCPEGQYHQLGEGAMVGKRVWDVRSRFHVRVGPLQYRQFTRLLPDGEDFLTVCQLIRLYVGWELSFAIRPVLARGEVPACQLTQPAGHELRLGRNTWLGDAALAGEIDAAVFLSRDLETESVSS